jgi:CheY-like chemotaxis protein
LLFICRTAGGFGRIGIEMAVKKSRSTEKASILIVEDEVIVAMELREKLTAMGWRVSGLATSGAEAIASAEADRPDLVLMDITIKGEMDGIQTAHHLQARHHIPVIFITAFVRPGLRRPRAFKDSFIWLSKPLVDEDLLQAIRRALDGKKKTAKPDRPRRLKPAPLTGRQRGRGC